MFRCFNHQQFYPSARPVCIAIKGVALVPSRPLLHTLHRLTKPSMHPRVHADLLGEGGSKQKAFRFPATSQHLQLGHAGIETERAEASTDWNSCVKRTMLWLVSLVSTLPCCQGEFCTLWLISQEIKIWPKTRLTPRCGYLWVLCTLLFKPVWTFRLLNG